MRLGIDYRLLASRENLVNRGIGRYTQQQLRHVVRLDTDNEYLLLCPQGSDTSLVLPEIRGAANVSFRFGPPASTTPQPADPYERKGLLRRSAEYQDWVHGLDLDLYHSTAPFVLEQVAPPAFDACPMVATVYDFIPLIFPTHYLKEPGPRAAYAGAARLVSSATRLIAISEGTRQDAEQYLGFPRAAIDCAWPFADECFRPMADDEVAVTLAGLRLPGRFVLTVAALHHTKNLELLFAAYARLSPSFRKALPLVVACHLDEVGAAHMRRWAGAYGVAEDIVLTGYLPDPQLAALYNRATLVAHPSRYEGFGLPVVEAMQCGAAVVTTTAPSLPEISAGAAALVDPDDAVTMAAAIEALSSDADARAGMGAAGIERAAAFSPEALARATLASYRATVGSSSDIAARRRVAVEAPARHALGVGRALPAAWDVEVFTDDEDGPVPDELLDAFPVHHRSALPRCPVDLVVGGGPVSSNRPSRLDVLLARARLGWAAEGLVVLDGDVAEDPGDDQLLAADVVVAPAASSALALRVAGAGKPLLATADDLAPLADPDELASRSAAARQWFEDQVASRRAPIDESTPAVAALAFDKLCEVEDFEHPELRDALHELGVGLPSTADWSMAMSLRALAHAGLLDCGKRVLSLGPHGVGLALHLTRRVGEVTLVAPWLEMDGSPVARALVLDPALVATAPFDRARLVVRHAALSRLPFPADSFDAVLACRATDCLTQEGVTDAVAEAVRVARPGGLVVLSVLVRRHGPARGPGVSMAWVQANLVGDGTELSDLSERTLTARRHFGPAFDPPVPTPGEPPLILSQGALLACLHLAVRKPAGQLSG